MLQYDVHPLNEYIYNHDNFFNEPQPFISCLHCNGKCDERPPVGIPYSLIDLKYGSANGRDTNQIKHDILPIHKLYCDFSCAKANVKEKDIMVFNYMLMNVYKIKDPLSIREALPQWTLEEFGGPLI